MTESTNQFDPNALKLVRLTNDNDAILQMFEFGLKMQMTQIEAEAGGDDFPSEEFIKRIRQYINMDSLFYQMTPIYSRYFTREEIAGLIAFFETSLGRKFVKNTSQIAQESFAANQAWLESFAEKMERDSDSTPVEGARGSSDLNKLFDFMGVDFSLMASAMVEGLIENAKKQMPDIPASVLGKARLNLNKETENLRGRYMDIYKRHYAQEEIAGLIRFFESPLGNKYAKCGPQISQEGQSVTQAYFESLTHAVLEEMFGEGS